MTPNLARAFSSNNLILAWKRTLTNTDAFYKEYFRDAYRAYSLSAPANLEDLRSRLVHNHFSPTYAIKIYLPKASGTLRPYTLLSVEDQIVYQALVNIAADRLYLRVRRNYNNTVFGNLYSGPSRIHFYKDWRSSYVRFSRSMEKAFAEGNDVTATFDLAACFDSIDQIVLGYFLRDLGLEREFNDFLCRLLGFWSATSSAKPIYQGHGIPQGPQPSGLLAECVLRYFDDNVRSTRTMRYFRYVDDIRLFAGSEKELRKQLVSLELRSKEVGLFPQSDKINIHRVKNIDDEIKTISRPPDPAFQKPDPDQVQVRRRLIQLTPRFMVADETKFKYLVARAAPHAQLTNRLLRIVEREPHLYTYVFRHLARSQLLPRSVCARALALLTQNDLYPTYSATLVRSLTGRIHPAVEKEFLDYCRGRLLGDPPASNCEMQAALACGLLRCHAITWVELYPLVKKAEWWGASQMIKSVESDLYGAASYEALVNESLRSDVADPALTAAELAANEGISVHKPIKEIQHLAQLSLRASGLIGRVQSGRCLVCEAMNDVLGSSLTAVDWKRILGRNYKAVAGRIARWRGYAESDATAWTNMTDTVNDFILDSLFNHDHTIGSYSLGNIGAVLTPGNRLAAKYPKLFKAVSDLHGARLESDLSHPISRKSHRLTKWITFGETKALRGRLREGYAELWKKW